MGSLGSAAELRRELCARNEEFAKAHKLEHALSYGELPVVVYCPEPECGRHGNFFQPSFAAILKDPEWARRLEKVHTAGRRGLPRTDRGWRELDSCTSSDALLMNIFCCPRVCSRAAVASMLGTEPSDVPQFGYRARVPLFKGEDRTEIDMKLGSLLVEAKLTEGDFQTQSAELVRRYRDFEDVFEVRALPQSRGRFLSYQLIRNVLAARNSGLRFCVMLDERRRDLLEAWYTIKRCIRDAELNTRCKVLTWQELAPALPGRLRAFLAAKYGIV